MALEENLSEDDLRVMAGAIKEENKGYRARYISGCVIAYWKEVDEHIIINLDTGNWQMPIKVIHPEDREKVSVICQRAVMDYLVENTHVFEGELYNNNFYPHKTAEGGIAVVTTTPLVDRIKHVPAEV